MSSNNDDNLSFELDSGHIDEFGMADLEPGEVAYLLRFKPRGMSFAMVCSACGRAVESKTDARLSTIFVQPCSCLRA